MNARQFPGMDIKAHYRAFALEDLSRLPEEILSRLHATLQRMGRQCFETWYHTHHHEVLDYTQGSDEEKESPKYQIDRGLYAYASWQHLCRSDLFYRAVRENHSSALRSSLSHAQLAEFGWDYARLLQDAEKIPTWPVDTDNPPFLF